MIDTVKLYLDKDKFTLLENSELSNFTVRGGVSRMVRNPSRNELRAGMYLPRLTLTKRPTRTGIQQSLTVEFSAPKLVYGNNFDELSDNDFGLVIDKLKESLNYLGVVVSKEDLINARVVCWHPSKNILLDNPLGCQVVINTLRKVDYTRVYSVQKTNFQDGEVLHFQCNSKDIAFYDKIADLMQARKSDKKSREDDNQLQVGILDVVGTVTDFSVLRFEVRINGIRALQHNFKSIRKEDLVFRKLFSAELSRNVLLEHWGIFSNQIDYLSLDVNMPLELLQNYLAENKDATPQSALAAVAGLFIANQESSTALRNTLDKRFGRHYWPKLKAHMKKIKGRRYSDVTKVTSSLNEFQPTRIEMLTKSIA
jgi:hypothetical protein